MCLYTKESEPSQATEDIKCYKVYLFDYNECCSPYIEMTIPNFGQYINTELGKAFFYYKEDIFYTISEGFHSFELLSDIKEFCENYFTNYLIVECIIPKGSFYYKGSFIRYSNYCSDTIILNKVVYSSKDFGSIYYHQ